MSGTICSCGWIHIWFISLVWCEYLWQQDGVWWRGKCNELHLLKTMKTHKLATVLLLVSCLHFKIFVWDQWSSKTQTNELYLGYIRLWIHKQYLFKRLIHCWIWKQKFKKKYTCTFYIPYCLCISWRGSKSKPDNSSSPYSPRQVNQRFSTGVTRLPRATSKWDATPPMEMSEGRNSHTLADRNHQTNGLVSYHMLLSIDHLLNQPLVCSMSHLLINHNSL